MTEHLEPPLAGKRDPLVAGVELPLHHHGRPEIGHLRRIRGSDEFARRNAADREVHAVQRQDAADHAGVGVESPLPVRIAQHDHRNADVRGSERAPHERLHAERGEVVVRDELAVDPLLIGGGRILIRPAREDPDRPARGDEVGHGAAAVAAIEVLGIGKEVLNVAAGAAGEPALESDERVAVPDRQRPPGDGVERAEDRDVEADAQRQRQDRDDRESGGAAQHARRVDCVPRRRFEERQTASFAPTLFQLGDAAERHQRGAARLGRRHPAPQIPLDQELDVRPHLLVELIVEAAAPQGAEDAGDGDADPGHHPNSPRVGRPELPRDDVSCGQATGVWHVSCGVSTGAPTHPFTISPIPFPLPPRSRA